MNSWRTGVNNRPISSSMQRRDERVNDLDGWSVPGILKSYSFKIRWMMASLFNVRRLSIRAISFELLLTIRFERFRQWQTEEDETMSNESRPSVSTMYFARLPVQWSCRVPNDLFWGGTRFEWAWHTSDECNSFETVNSKDCLTGMRQHLQSNGSQSAFDQWRKRMLPWLQSRYFMISLRQRSKGIRNVSVEVHCNQKWTVDGSQRDKTATKSYGRWTSECLLVRESRSDGSTLFEIFHLIESPRQGHGQLLILIVETLQNKLIIRFRSILNELLKRKTIRGEQSRFRGRHTWRRIKIRWRMSTKIVLMRRLMWDLARSFCLRRCSPSKPESIVFDVSSSSMLFKKLKSLRIFSISSDLSVCSWISLLILLSNSLITCSIFSKTVDIDRSTRRRSSKHVRTWSRRRSSW